MRLFRIFRNWLQRKWIRPGKKVTLFNGEQFTVDHWEYNEYMGHFVVFKETHKNGARQWVYQYILNKKIVDPEKCKHNWGHMFVIKICFICDKIETIEPSDKQIKSLCEQIINKHENNGIYKIEDNNANT